MNVFHSDSGTDGLFDRFQQRIATLSNACTSALRGGYRAVSRRSVAVWSAVQLKAKHLRHR